MLDNLKEKNERPSREEREKRSEVSGREWPIMIDENTEANRGGGGKKTDNNAGRKRKGTSATGGSHIKRRPAIFTPHKRKKREEAERYPSDGGEVVH